MSDDRLTIIDDPFVPERADKVARAAGQAVGRTGTFEIEFLTMTARDRELLDNVEWIQREHRRMADRYEASLRDRCADLALLRQCTPQPSSSQP